MTMNRMERLYKIHAMLSKGTSVSLASMKENLEVSRSTLARDLEYLRTFFEAPIVYCRQSHGYGYDQSSQSFELPGFWLNSSELRAIVLSQELIREIHPGLLEPMLLPIRKRLEKLLAESGHDPSEIARRIRVQKFHGRPVGSHTFQSVCDALLSRKQLELTYHGRGKDLESSRAVHPQRILYYRDNWYLLAFCSQANGLRVFAIEKILTLKAGGDCLNVKDSELDDFCDSGFGIFRGSSSEIALLKFYLPNSRWVSDEIWHPSQKGHFQGDDYYLEIPYSNPSELILEILRHGHLVEVISPPSLRQAVMQSLQMAIHRYV